MSTYDRIIDDVNDMVNATLQSAANSLRIIPGSEIVMRYIASSYQNDPLRSLFEFFLLAFAVHYFLASKYSTSNQNYVSLTDVEVDEMVDDWEPDPLVDPLTVEDEWKLKAIDVIQEQPGQVVKLANDESGREYLNFASRDCYNTIENEALKTRAINTIRKYGVGSCGPAGFYGNQDAHVNAEADLAKFLDAEAAILYSQGLATASSVIPCFLKRGDVIVADKHLNVSIRSGITLSRATVFWYDTCDMADLKSVLERAVASHKKGPVPRRFIITESIYDYHGQSPDLVEIVRLSKLFKFRIILDESNALLVLGKAGKGLVEESGVLRQDIEISIGSLSTAFGSAGGFCAGAKFMVEHQRITSLAYTFSATMPAYLADKTSAVIEMFSKDPSPIEALNAKVELARSILAKNPNIKLISRSSSPTVIFTTVVNDQDETFIQKIVDSCKASGILICRQIVLPDREALPVTSVNIRVFINNSFSNAQIKEAMGIVSKSVDSVIHI